jgi:outer membrane protein assembly factor BamB
MAEVQSFRCPSCGAPLQYDGGDHATVHCDFCGNTVIVPEHMRRRSGSTTSLFAHSNRLQEIVSLINDGLTDEAIDLFRRTYNVGWDQAAAAVQQLEAGRQVSTVSIGGGTTAAASSRNRGCLIGFIAVILLIVAVTTIIPLLIGGATLWGTLEIFGTAVPAISELSDTGRSEPGNQPPDIAATLNAAPAASPTPAFAGLISSFGAEGIAPGQFNDARALAILPSGTYFTGDYQGGRVQQFDAGDTFQKQIQVNPEMPLRDIAVGSDGLLYVVQRGEITVYDPASGQAVNTITTGDPFISLDQLVITAAGDLIGLDGFGRQVIRLVPGGLAQELVHIENVAQASDFDYLAVDGAGNIYTAGRGKNALGRDEPTVYRFTPTGQFINSFVHAPERTSSINGLAVDGQGRIYVSDGSGIYVYTNDGRPLGVIDVDGVPFDLVFTPQGELLVTNRTTIFRYRLNN